MRNERHRVVVVGGGFAGLEAARKLARLPVEVTLVDRRNYHLFQPLAYQVATGTLAPGEVCHPLRAIFRGRRNVRVLLAEVTGFDLGARRVELRPAEDDVPTPSWLEYDSLIVAAGSRYSYFGNEGWERVATDLKSLEGGLETRRRILAALEAAEWEPDPERRRAWLTFVVAGGGPTGVEMAGQVAEIAREVRGDFRRADTGAAEVLLVETSDRMLPEFPPSLSKRASRALRRLGVTPLTGHTVADMDAQGVTIVSPDGPARRHPARTVIWAAGVVPEALAHALAEAAGADIDPTGRVVADPDLTIAGHPEVLALGDMVAIRHNGHVAALPGLAAVAKQQGRHAARVVAARLRGERPAPFHYRDKGNLAIIGRNRAVADLRVLRLSGPLAWVTWLAVHIFFLIGFQSRAVVLTRWGFNYVTRNRGSRLISRMTFPTVIETPSRIDRVHDHELNDDRSR